MWNVKFHCGSLSSTKLCMYVYSYTMSANRPLLDTNAKSVYKKQARYHNDFSEPPVAASNWYLIEELLPIKMQRQAHEFITAAVWQQFSALKPVNNNIIRIDPVPMCLSGSQSLAMYAIYRYPVNIAIVLYTACFHAALAPRCVFCTGVKLPVPWRRVITTAHHVCLYKRASAIDNFRQIGYKPHDGTN